MAYAAMKPTKPGLEEPQEQVHKIRITLSSKNVKNLEKGFSLLTPTSFSGFRIDYLGSWFSELKILLFQKCLMQFLAHVLMLMVFSGNVFCLLSKVEQSMPLSFNLIIVKINGWFDIKGRILNVRDGDFNPYRNWQSFSKLFRLLRILEYCKYSRKTIG